MSREIVKIIREICKEEKIDFKSFSSDYILKLEKNQRTMYIYGNKFPNNTAAIEQICNDKAALSDILDCYDIPHVKHYYFDSPVLEDYCSEKGNWSKMQKLLKQYGVLVCKPTKGTGGRNIYRVKNNKELEYATLNIFKGSNSLCISPYFDIQNEYRILMVGDEVQYVFRKIRPFIIGDGKSTVAELFKAIPNNDKISITNKIEWQSILNLNEKLELSWKHNLGQGATPQIITDSELITKLSSIAKKCVATLNLGFVSIDIIETNGEFLVLEINSGVMVEKFATSSEESYRLVKKALTKAIQIYLHLDTKYYLTRVRKSHFVLPILYKIAKKKGVKIIEDPEEKNFAIFLFPNGKCFVAKDYPFNINSSGSSSLASNKNACNSFIKSLGYSVPKEKYFVRKPNIKISLNEIERCLANKKECLGFDYPMIIKPNNLSQGAGVFIANNDEECIRFSQEAFLKSKIILLQEFCRGREYRIVVLKDKIIQAYQRVPFSIKGNGKNTIRELLELKVFEFKNYGRDKDVDINDPRVLKHIIDSGYNLDSILETGKELILQDIANLSLGGTSIDAINMLDDKFKDLAMDIASKLNLTLCGIDIIVSDISDIKKGYNILEINSSPGLDNYLYSDRKKQNKYVENLYTLIFDEIGTK